MCFGHSHSDFLLNLLLISRYKLCSSHANTAELGSEWQRNRRYRHQRSEFVHFSSPHFIRTKGCESLGHLIPSPIYLLVFFWIESMQKIIHLDLEWNVSWQ